MSTFMAKAETVERKWYVLDAAGKPQQILALQGQLDDVIRKMLAQPAGQKAGAGLMRPGEILLSAGVGGEAKHP